MKNNLKRLLFLSMVLMILCASAVFATDSGVGAPNLSGVVSDAAAYPTGEWRPGTFYSINTIISYQDADYLCLQSHTSRVGLEPFNAPTLWRIHSAPDPVLFWNAIALQAVANDHSGTFGPPEQGGPPRSARALAIVHAAIFDAVNSIDRSFKPYLTLVPGAADANVHSAVATSAYLTLVALYPSQRPFFDTARQIHLSLIPPSPGKSKGIQVGAIVANAILLARSNDGSNAPMFYIPKPFPGFHREDPLNPGQGFGDPQFGRVRPFVILSGAQFRPQPPPALTSPAYTAAYNDVKRLGGDGIITPTIRTPEQTLIGYYWSYDGNPGVGTPPRLFNQITRVIARQRGNNVVQNARLFGLINLAMGDAGISSWEAKYFYQLWRPILGIRESDPGTGPTGLGDGNPFTIGDPNWTPLGAPATNRPGDRSFTPNFPSYTSGHATFAGALFRIIALFYGTDNIPFTFVSDELNGRTIDMRGFVRPFVPRSFSTLTQASLECARSRIYLGVHWQFDADAGIAEGNGIANFVFNKALQPVANPVTAP